MAHSSPAEAAAHGLTAVITVVSCPPFLPANSASFWVTGDAAEVSQGSKKLDKYQGVT
jgi:hypothetical protein